ncbi:MAG: DUF697 domain-containing protein [Thermoflexibacter sp.]|jgi:uncharacterized protein (DUF697 family)|nr:DUF697 domain-containing protein [Thermoflexibacter sp.]
MIDYIFSKIKEKFEDIANEINQNKKAKADKIVQNSVLWTIGAGFIPIPIADMVAVTAIQIDMIKKISELYEVNYSEANLKSWISTLSGSVISRFGADAIKFIPGIGSVIGGISVAALSGASTYAVGQVFIEHFENGGNFSNFEVDKFVDFYKKQFERGRSFVEDLQKKKDNSEEVPFEDIKDEKATSSEPPKSNTTNSNSSTNNDEIVKRLKELSELRQQGIISEEEFKMLKERLLKDN